MVHPEIARIMNQNEYSAWAKNLEEKAKKMRREMKDKMTEAFKDNPMVSEPGITIMIKMDWILQHGLYAHIIETIGRDVHLDSIFTVSGFRGISLTLEQAKKIGINVEIG